MVKYRLSWKETLNVHKIGYVCSNHFSVSNQLWCLWNLPDAMWYLFGQPPFMSALAYVRRASSSVPINAWQVGGIQGGSCSWKTLSLSPAPRQTRLWQGMDPWGMTYRSHQGFRMYSSNPRGKSNQSLTIVPKVLLEKLVACWVDDAETLSKNELVYDKLLGCILIRLKESSPESDTRCLISRASHKQNSYNREPKNHLGKKPKLRYHV
jgi:hypothetical protein